MEGEPGFEGELAALDLQSLPPTLPVDTLSALSRELVAWMLDEVLADFVAVDRDAALATPLGRTVLGAFVVGDDDVDLATLRRGLVRYDACQKRWPRTLAAFREEIFDFSAEPDQLLQVSASKGVPRAIWRDPTSGAFIAQTLVDSVVRETEVVLTDHHGDGTQVQFLAYDAAGDLLASSQFGDDDGVEVSGAVPYTCMACHRTPGLGFNVVSPEAP